jgi:hypothetical protein
MPVAGGDKGGDNNFAKEDMVKDLTASEDGAVLCITRSELSSRFCSFSDLWLSRVKRLASLP